MERLETLSKVLRYAGLNLTPQIIALVLDKPTSDLIKALDALLEKNPDPKNSDIDAIVDTIQKAAEEAAEADKGKPVPSKKKLEKA